MSLATTGEEAEREEEGSIDTTMTPEDYEKKNRAELEEAKKKLLEDFTKEAAKKDSVSFMEIMAQKMDEAQGTHGKIVVAKMDQEKPCGASSYLQEAFI